MKRNCLKYFMYVCTVVPLAWGIVFWNMDRQIMATFEGTKLEPAHTWKGTFSLFFTPSRKDLYSSASLRSVTRRRSIS